MNCDDAQELMTGLIDGELAIDERELVEAHLDQCVRCRRELAAEQAVKQKIRGAADSIGTPPRLRDRILSDPRVFPRDGAALARWREYLGPLVTWQAAAIAALLILALPFLYFANSRDDSMALAVVESSDLFLNDKVPLITATSEDQLVEQLVQAVGGDFQPMGYDLTELAMKPVGGAVREIGGRKVLIAVYRGPDRSLLCYTFLGSDQDAPAHAAKFLDENKKITFFAFSRGAVNAVLHREGRVICILAGEMAMEDLLALTRSKARSH
jgi:anti-sigma factor (TIGR02949 family)